MSGIFYGWWVVLALSLVAFFAPMGRYLLTPLFPFVEREMGWSREAIGLAFSIHFWVYAAVSLWVGHLVDTIGGRKTVFMGGAILFVSLPLLSISQALWQVYAIFGVILAFGISMTHFVPNTSIARKWFVRKAGLATGLVIMGTSLGFGILTPIIGHVCGLVGWRMTTLVCGLVFGAVVMSLAVFLIRSTPESMGLRPDGVDSLEALDDPQGPMALSPEAEVSLGQSLRRRDFWAFLLSYSVMAVALQGILAHIVMWAVDLGAAPAQAGLFMAALTLPSVPLRVLGGWLGDRFGKRRILILFTALTSVIWVCGWILVRDTTTLVVFALALGFAYSTPFSLYTPYLGDLFGRSVVGTLMGAMTFGHGIVGGLGTFLWGWIADRTGSYSPTCALSAACYGISVLGLLMTRPGAVRESARS
jgi:MFS family permease